ncbi:MAG: hypothetical protein H0X29_03085 [Parachlamydiaceae bacterium]|nr:hypothetical protein [Parachlamydiaceae bacterium]
MKTLKNFFSTLVLMLVVCQVGQINASQPSPLPIYQNVISDISLGYDCALLTGTIKLVGGQIFHIKDYKKRDDNLIKTWKRLDVISFEAKIVDEALLLIATPLNVPKEDIVEPYLVFDVLESHSKGLKIVEIQNDGEFVKLSDNSVWEFSFYNQFSTKKWSVGEHVIVQGQGEVNHYDFINLDIILAKKATSATGAFVIH